MTVAHRPSDAVVWEGIQLVTRPTPPKDIGRYDSYCSNGGYFTNLLHAEAKNRDVKDELTALCTRKTTPSPPAVMHCPIQGLHVGIVDLTEPYSTFERLHRISAVLHPAVNDNVLHVQGNVTTSQLNSASRAL